LAKLYGIVEVKGYARSAKKLTTSQFFLLIALYEENGILISKLAEKVALDKATLTGIIDRLERDGLVERRDDPKDRRAIRVYLTPKAESLREELLEIYHRNNSRFLSVLSEEEREVFERVVQKLESIRGYTDEE
jgi:DNA-binding MarR family transcriptional regulator